MDLITRNELGEFLGETVIEDDIADQTIAHVSRRMARYCDRDDWGESAERTEYFNGGSKYIMCRYFPISSIASIHDDTERDFDSTSLVDSDDYWIMQDPEANGIIYLSYCPAEFVQNLKVVYTGGYVSTGAIPSDLKTAALMQVKHEVFQLQAARMNEEERDFLPEVMELLIRYKRSRNFA